MDMAPRVYFVAPEDGANISVDHPVVFEFGIENCEIAAVPEEVEQPRPDVGHDHLGVDTECLPVGEIIPMADPWLHFGDASNTTRCCSNRVRTRSRCRWVTTSTAP